MESLLAEEEHDLGEEEEGPGVVGLVEEGVVGPGLEDVVGRVVVQHGGVESRQLEGQSAVPVGLGLTALQGGQEDVPGPGLLPRPHHRLGQHTGSLQLDLLPAVQVLGEAPGLVEVLLGEVLVVGLAVQDGPQLQVGSGTDQRGRVEVEDCGQTADTFLTLQCYSPPYCNSKSHLDVVRLSEAVRQPQEGGVPRVACGGHDDDWWSVNTDTHPSYS